MTGRQIFDKLQWAAHIYGPGSAEFLYGNLLFDALRIHGEEQLFKMLEDAEQEGKQIDLQYPVVEGVSNFDNSVMILR